MPSRTLLACVTFSAGCFLDAGGAPLGSGGDGADGGAPTSMSTGGSDTTPSSGASGGGGNDMDMPGGGPVGGAPSSCGNGDIDAEEECDGQADCTADCELGADSQCFGAPPLPLGESSVDVTQESQAVFVSFDDFTGTSCQEADVPNEAKTEIFRYVTPALYPEGLFASAGIDDDEPLIYAYRGCGDEPLDCGAGPEDQLGRILVPIQPPGSILFVGVTERGADLGTFDLYVRPFRYYDTFSVTPPEWSFTGGWMWSSSNRAVELPNGSEGAAESSEIVVGGLEEVLLGFSYRTNGSGSARIALSFDGEDFTPMGDLPNANSDYVWRDLVAPVPPGAERMRVRIAGEAAVSVTTVMFGPVVPGSVN